MDELLQKNKLLKRMVVKVAAIANLDPLQDTPSVAYRLVRNTLRRNVMRVQSIVVLDSYDKMSDSALEIARNIIEDAISITFIISDKDPEKCAYQFFEYRWVQAKQDLDYYSKIPDYVGADLNKNRTEINKEFKRVVAQYTDFTNKDGSIRHSWSTQGIEGMAEQLRKRGLYNKFEKHNLLRAYQLGSRKTHFNPVDLLGFHDQNAWDKASIKSLDITIKGAAAGFTSLVVRYFDVVRHYDSSNDGSKLIEELYDIQKEIHESGSDNP